MPTTTSTPLRLVASLLGLLVASFVQAEPAAPPRLPAGNPYAPAFAALAKLTPEDKDALEEGKPASPAAAPIVAEINRALAAGRQSTTVDWGVDYEHFNFETITPGISESRSITQIALAGAEHLPPPAFIDRTLETLTLARHLGRDGPLISLLIQIALERRTCDFLQKHLARLSPQDAARLVAGLDALPPGCDLATALAVEKMAFVDRLTADIRQVLDSLNESAPGASDLSARLRMAGIVTDGPVTSVGLEKDNLSFWLKPGDCRHGITLLNVSLPRDEALLSANGSLVRLRLSSRKITRLDFSRLPEAVKKLPPESLLRSQMEQADENAGENFIRNIEQSTREIGELYADAIAHPEHFTDAAAFAERVKHFSPLSQNTAEMLPKLIASEKKARDLQAKLRAGLSAIANPRPGSPAPADRPPDRTPTTETRPH